MILTSANSISKFRHIICNSIDPVTDLREQFITLAVDAGMQFGDDGYQEVVDSLRVALAKPFGKQATKNTFDYLDPSDGSLQWRK